MKNKLFKMLINFNWKRMITKMFFMAAIIMAACVYHATKDFEGSYTRESSGEFSRASDTLIIMKLESSSPSTGYIVVRKTGYTRITDGVPQAKEWKTERMMTTYEDKTQQLTDQKTGRVFTFTGKELLFGTALYKKIY